MAPAGTPQSIVQRLNRLLREVLTDPAIVKTTRLQGLHAAPSTPEELTALMKEELVRWRDVVAER